jgi:hypothetical protein
MQFEISERHVVTRTFTIIFLLGTAPPAPTGTGTMALDPTFGSFTLLKLVSHYVNRFLW